MLRLSDESDERLKKKKSLNLIFKKNFLYHFIVLAAVVVVKILDVEFEALTLTNTLTTLPYIKNTNGKITAEPIAAIVPTTINK